MSTPDVLRLLHDRTRDLSSVCYNATIFNLPQDFM
jgi:hypothetical protein